MSVITQLLVNFHFSQRHKEMNHLEYEKLICHKSTTVLNLFWSQPWFTRIKT